jgi:aryl-alcohol dehydrogenase
MQIVAAIAYQRTGPFVVEAAQLDEPRANEVLVKIAGVGLCHTDLTALTGKIIPINLPAVFGHEGSGTVAAVGAHVTKFKVEDRVTMSFCSCGHCTHCTAGHPAYCESSSTLNYAGARDDGSTSIQGCSQQTGERASIASNFFGQSSFANYALTYERNLVAVPEGFPLELAGPLGCGIQTGAGAILNVLRPAKGSSVLITGGGSVGLSGVLAAVVAGCGKIIVVEPVLERRELALALGATHALDPTSPDFGAILGKLAPAGFNHFFDSTGLPHVIAQGINRLGLRGSAALVGIPPELDSALAMPLLPVIGAGRSIHGVVEGDSNPEVFIPYLMDLYLEGRLPIDRLISTYRLSDINRAAADHREGRCVKAVLIP